MGLVPGTGPTNSNKFEFVGLVAGTKFWSNFGLKWVVNTKGLWSPGLVAGTSRRDQSQGLFPSCVPTFSGLESHINWNLIPRVSPLRRKPENEAV